MDVSNIKATAVLLETFIALPSEIQTRDAAAAIKAISDDPNITLLNAEFLLRGSGNHTKVWMEGYCTS